MRLLGILLVIFGVVCLAVGGLTFFVPRDVIDLGVFSITVHENLVIPLPPIIGLISLVLGLAMTMGGPEPAPPAPPPPY